MLELSRFRRVPFSAVQIVAFLVTLSFTGLFLYLQNIKRFSGLPAGLVLLCVSGPSMLVAPLVGRAIERIKPRFILALGMAATDGGSLLMTLLDPHSGWTALIPGFGLMGVGIGMSSAPLANVAVSVAPSARCGMASSTNDTFRQAGTATGVALLGAIFQSHVAASLRDALPQEAGGASRRARRGGQRWRAQPRAAAGSGGAARPRARRRGDRLRIVARRLVRDRRGVRLRRRAGRFLRAALATGSSRRALAARSRGRTGA